VVASYVKWIESAGARVVFVYYDAPQADLKQLLTTQLNGLVWTGGQSQITEGLYATTSQYLLSLIVAMNKKADYFPLWATCLGFQQVSVYFANDSSILVDRQLQNVLVPLNFTQDPMMSSMLNRASDDIIAAFTYENITVNHHNNGVDPSSFVENPFLAGNFTVLATNMDVNGKEFVSLIEGYGFPVYASQFHPEKNQFEWSQTWASDPNAHMPDATSSMQYLSDFVVKEARKSQHVYSGGVPTAGTLAYNVNPLYTGKMGPNYYEQTYFFKNQK
jgi:gamma-glutamyl hydrolase